MREEIWIVLALILGPILCAQGYNAAVWDAEYNEQTRIDMIMVFFPLLTILMSVLLARINPRACIKIGVSVLLFATLVLVTYQAEKEDIHLELIPWVFHLQLTMVAFAILAIVSAVVLWSLRDKELMEEEKDKAINALKSENEEAKRELEGIKKVSKDSSDVIRQVEATEENLSRKMDNLSKRETKHFNETIEHIETETQKIRKAIATARGANTRTSNTLRTELKTLSSQIQILEALAFNTEKELNKKLLTVKQGNSKTVNSIQRKLNKIKQDLEELQKAKNELIEIPAGEEVKATQINITT